MGKSAFVFGVDLDGVVADFYAGLRPVAAEWLGVNVDTLTPEVTFGLPEWGIPEAPGGYDALHKFAVTQRNLFASLSPIPSAPLTLRRLSKEGIRIRVITHRLFIKFFHETAIKQTIEWLDYHDIPYWDICFMKDKAAVGANLYIDDSPSNVRALRDAGHKTIVFTNSTNRDLPGPRADNWGEVAELVLTSRREYEQREESESIAGT